MDKRVEVRVTLSGREEIVETVLCVLRHVERLGNWGCSRYVAFAVDGDGVDRLKTDIGRGPLVRVTSQTLYDHHHCVFDHDVNIVGVVGPGEDSACQRCVGRGCSACDARQSEAEDENPKGQDDEQS